jgi:ubiquinone/menaquinone biosynthesis C-methylase UbiE
VDAGCLAAAREWAAHLGLANVEFTQGDAYRTGLEGGSFDLVHVRFFLTTVGGDQALLAEALRLVRPGGVVAFQEADIATLTCYPPLPAWDRIKGAYVALFQRIGADGHVGRRLHFLLRRAGLVDVRFRPFILGFTHTDPMARFMPETAASMRHAFRQAGVMTDQELDEAIQACERHLAEPDTISTSYIVFQVWGRKPAAAPVIPTQQEGVHHGQARNETT